MKDILLYGALIAGALTMGSNMIVDMMNTADVEAGNINAAVTARTGDLIGEINALD